MINDKVLCNCSLFSGSVRKDNIIGKKFYENFGFKFLNDDFNVVDYHYYDKYNPTIIHPPYGKREFYPMLSEEEFETSIKKNVYFGIIIPSEEKQSILMREFSYPYIEYNGEKFDCTTNFKESKKKI